MIFGYSYGMANQRAIAKAAGVNQATVSLALRNSPSIPESTRARIKRIAEELDYQPHSYVSTLMSHIRSGRVPRDKGCIAVLTASGRKTDKFPAICESTYKRQLKGLKERAQKIGFTTEIFNMSAGELSFKRLNDIIQARGIAGIIVTNTDGWDFREFDQLVLNDFSLSTIAYHLPGKLIDRVATHHRHNVHIAYEHVRRRGYKRIGFCLPEEAVDGVDLNWKAGFLLEHDVEKKSRQIPLFVGKPERTPIAKFEAWLGKWKPEMIMSLVGHEYTWFKQLGMRVPEDIGMACLNLLPETSFSGVEENHELIGATAIDLVANQIMLNERGFRKQPKLILIDGAWVEGNTLRPAPSL